MWDVEALVKAFAVTLLVAGSVLVFRIIRLAEAADARHTVGLGDIRRSKRSDERWGRDAEAA